MVFQTLNKGLCVFSCIETFDISRYFAKVRNGGGGRRVLQACLQLQPCKPDLLAGRVHNRPDWCLPPARRTLRNAHCETHTVKHTLQNAHWEMQTEWNETSHFEMPPAKLTLQNVHCEIQNVQCLLQTHTTKCTLQTSHYEMHTEKCAFSSKPHTAKLWQPNVHHPVWLKNAHCKRRTVCDCYSTAVALL